MREIDPMHKSRNPMVFFQPEVAPPGVLFVLPVLSQRFWALASMDIPVLLPHCTSSCKNDQTFQKKLMEKPNTNSLRVVFGTGLNRHRGLNQRTSRVYFYINSNIHQLGYVKNPTFSQLWPQNLHSQTLKVRCFQSQHIQKTCEGIGALGVFTGLEFQ